VKPSAFTKTIDVRDNLDGFIIGETSAIFREDSSIIKMITDDLDIYKYVTIMTVDKQLYTFVLDNLT
jgi:hypothetical protein